MARLRYNGLSTTLGGSGLTNVATSVTFAAALTHSNGTNVPTIVSPDYIPLAILGATGHLSEIVYLTAYTAGATTGTITRGQEGTTGAAHSSGDVVTQAQLVLDYTGEGGGDYFRSGFYTQSMWTTTSSTQSMVLSRVFFIPLLVPVRRAFDTIAVPVSASGASTNVRLGIYTHAAGVPATLIVDAGTVSVASTGTAAISISQTLDPGVYWLAAVAQGTNAPTFTAYPTNYSVYVAKTGPSPVNAGSGYIQSSVAGALPSTATPTVWDGPSPAVALRAL